MSRFRSGVLMVGLVLVAATGGAESDGVPITVWDLQTLAPGKVYPTTITAVNTSCPGAQTVVATVQGAPWFRITGPTEFRGLRPGQTETSAAEVDTRGLEPGYYHGWIRLRCTTCPPPPRCSQNIGILEVILRIPAPATLPGTGGSEPAPPEGGSRGSDAAPEPTGSPGNEPGETPVPVPERLCGVSKVEGRFAPTQVVWQDDPVFEDQPTKRLTQLAPTLLEAELAMVKDRRSLLFGTIRPVGARPEEKRRKIFVRGETDGTTSVPVKFRFLLANGGPRRLLWESGVVGRVPLSEPCRPGSPRPFEAELDTPTGVPPENTFDFANEGGYTLTAQLVTESGTETGIEVRVIGDVVATRPPRIFFQPLVLAPDMAEVDRRRLRDATRELERASGLDLPDWYPVATAPLPTRTLQIRQMVPTAQDRAAAERFRKEFPDEDAGGLMRYVLNEAIARQLEAGGAFDDADRIVAVLARADFNRFRTGVAAGAGAFTNSQKVSFVDKDVAPFTHTVAHELAHTLPFAWTSRQIERECRRAYHNDDDQNVAHGFEITRATKTDRRWIEGVRPVMGRSHRERAAITQCTYWHLLNQLVEGPPDPPVVLAQGYILSRGRATDGVLLPAYQFDSVADLDDGKEGSWAIQLRDAKGRKLGRFPFEPIFEYPHGGERPVVAFSHRVPELDGTARIDLLGPKGLLDSLSYSDHAPEVTIATARPANGILALRWTGSDADGDELLYAVLYSSDGGGSWATLAFEQTEPAFSIELDQAGSGHSVRVIASDGARSGEARIDFETEPSS